MGGGNKKGHETENGTADTVLGLNSEIKFADVVLSKVTVLDCYQVELFQRHHRSLKSYHHTCLYVTGSRDDFSVHASSSQHTDWKEPNGAVTRRYRLLLIFCIFITKIIQFV